MHPVAKSRSDQPANAPRVALASGHGPMRILVAGDLHTAGAPALAAALQRIREHQHLDAVLLLGDNFDGCGAQSSRDPQWRDFGPLLRVAIPIYPLLGNHDYGNPKHRFGMTFVCGSPDPQSELDVHAWIFPARNYVITTDFADIIMADTTPVALGAGQPILGSATSQQVEDFVARELARDTRRWKIVAGHHDVFHSGIMRHRDSEDPGDAMVRFARMMERGGADLYLSGHQHQLELLEDGPRNPVFLISGAAGDPKRPAILKRIDARSRFLAGREHKTSGFAILEIARDSLRLSFIDEDGRPLSPVFDYGNRLRDGRRLASARPATDATAGSD